MFNKIKVVLIFLFFGLIFSFIKDSREQIRVGDRAPIILLFNCNYGAGHKMATQGILESLPECNVRVVDIYKEPLKSLDPMREIFPSLGYEELYNNLAKKEYNSLLNFAGKVGPKVFLLQRHKIEKLLKDFIVKDKPDMIISCIPLVNPMLLNVAEELNIPLLVVTTDIDISAFCLGFNKKPSGRFYITVPFSKDLWDDKFAKKIPDEVKNSLKYQFGYPTRSAFSKIFKKSRLDEIRKEYDIQKNEKVVLIMMGGNTAQAAIDYANLLNEMTCEEIYQILGNDKDKIRLICLCGDVSKEVNKSLMDKLNSLNKNNRIVIHACPGTPHIAELVSLPELCTVISKPGGSTVNEMIKKKVPMIYHISKTPLSWEKGNMEYGVDRQLGVPFQINDENRKDLVKALSTTFTLHRKFHDDAKAIPEADADFSENLRATVKEMLYQ